MAATNTPLSPAEWAFLSTLLGLVAEQFSYKSSTDYPLDANDENKALACAAIKHAGLSGDWGDEDASWEDYVADVMAEDDQVVTFMDWMAAHLSARCQALADSAGEAMTEAMTEAERAAIIELLGVALEDHDEAEEMDLVPYAIEAGDENRAILAQVSPEESRPPHLSTSVPLKAILIYFAERVASS